VSKIGEFVVREIREAVPATILFLLHTIALTKAAALGVRRRTCGWLIVKDNRA